MKLLFGLLAVLLWVIPAHAETATLTWLLGTETDLAKVKVYRQLLPCATATVPATALVTLGKVLTHTDTTIPAGTIAVCYWVSALDLTGNESPKSAKAGKAFPVTPPVVPPSKAVVTVVAVTASSMAVSVPPASDGAGGTAKVNVRYAKAPALTNFGWGAAPSATCPTFPCIIPGLDPITKYEVQAVYYREGTPNVFGPISAVASGTTLDNTPPPVESCMVVTSNTGKELVVRLQPCP